MLNGKGTRDDDNPSSKKALRLCLCGADHLFAQCLFLNPSVRSSHWVENPAVRRKVNEGLRNKKLKQKVQKMLPRKGENADTSEDDLSTNLVLAALETRPSEAAVTDSEGVTDAFDETNSLALTTSNHKNVAQTN